MGLQVVTSISYCYCYIVEVDEPNQKIYTKFQAHAYMQKKISNNRMNKKNIYTKSWSSIIIKSEYIIIEQNQRFWSIKKYITKKKSTGSNQNSYIIEHRWQRVRTNWKNVKDIFFYFYFVYFWYTLDILLMTGHKIIFFLLLLFVLNIIFWFLLNLWFYERIRAFRR